MSTLARRTRAERRAQQILEAQGWTVVRARPSFGPFDLVAFNRIGLRLIQVKMNRIPTRLEFAGLQVFDNFPVGTTKEIWRFFDHEPQPEIAVLGLRHAERGQECRQPSQ